MKPQMSGWESGMGLCCSLAITIQVAIGVKMPSGTMAPMDILDWTKIGFLKGERENEPPKM